MANLLHARASLAPHPRKTRAPARGSTFLSVSCPGISGRGVTLAPKEPGSVAGTTSSGKYRMEIQPCICSPIRLYGCLPACWWPFVVFRSSVSLHPGQTTPRGRPPRRINGRSRWLEPGGSRWTRKTSEWSSDGLPSPSTPRSSCPARPTRIRRASKRTSGASIGCPGCGIGRARPGISAA